MMLRFSCLVLSTLLMLTPALAHTGVGSTIGFANGFMHPVGGIDHVLAMVAVGLFAALPGGRALWLLPISFLTIGQAASRFDQSAFACHPDLTFPTPIHPASATTMAAATQTVP